MQYKYFKFFLLSLVLIQSTITAQNTKPHNDITQRSGSVYLLDTLKTSEFYDNNIIWEGSPIIKYFYNSKALKNEIISFVIDTLTNKQIFKKHDIIQYDENNRLYEDIYQEYKITDTSEYWLNVLKTNYLYDNNSNLTDKINQTYKFWGVFEYWVNSDKYSFLYDSTNKMIEQIYFEKDPYSDSWIYNNKYTFIYDSLSRTIEKIYQLYKDKLWNNKVKYVSIYNDFENSLETQIHLWNTVKNKWVYNKRQKIFYNEYNDTTQFWQSLIINDSTWEPYTKSNKFEYYYSNLGNRLLRIKYNYQSDSLFFKPYDSTIYIYNNSNNLIEKKYIRNYDTGWVNLYKEYFKYDIDNTISEYDLQYLIYNYLKKIEYIYFKLTSIDNPFFTEDKYVDILSVQPNPAIDNIKIKINITKESNVKIYLYDLSMQNKFLIQNQYYEAGCYNFTYYIDSFPSGTYFVEMQTDDNKRVIRKLLIIK